MRVWTNVGDAHIGFFASLDAIADAKGRDPRTRGTQTLSLSVALMMRE